MREIPAAFSGGAMTLARAWLVTRRDGTQMGFTDHDGDIEFDYVKFHARTGLGASDMTSATGFEVTGGEVSGALSSLGITEADIAAGLYDQARVDFYHVDWTNPVSRILVDTTMIGEIRRNGSAFICEMRGLTSLYQEEKGRLYQRSCAANLGDSGCKVDLTSTHFRYRGIISATHGDTYFECDADAQVFNFTGGEAHFMSGANLDQRIEIKSHSAIRNGSAIWLWQIGSGGMSIGDVVVLTVGCDKSFRTCRDTFRNSKNFRGFPHIPGTDFIVRVADEGDSTLDGGSLFK